MAKSSSGTNHVKMGVVEDNGDGTYWASVTTTLAATYKLLIVLMPPHKSGRGGPKNVSNVVRELSGRNLAQPPTADGGDGDPPEGRTGDPRLVESGALDAAADAVEPIGRPIRLSIARRDSDLGLVAGGGLGAGQRVSALKMAAKRSNSKWKARIDQRKLEALSEEQQAAG